MPSAQVFVGFVNSTGGEILGKSKQAFVTATASGATALVAAVPGKQIAVVAALATNNSTTEEIIVTMQSDSTAISAPHILATAGGGFDKNAPLGTYIWVTGVGQPLNISLDDTGNVGIDIVYYET